VIAFRGSVFSPTYFHARNHRIDHDPDEFSGINVVLYRPGGDRWVFTEPSPRDVTRQADTFRVAGSRLRWRDGVLVIDIDERTALTGARVRGQVRLFPEAAGEPVALDPNARHLWVPVAPRARIEVALSEPDVHFTGSGYHDSNYGRQPLEACFTGWSWSRAETAHGAAIVYDVDLGDRTVEHGFSFLAGGRIEPWDPGQHGALPRTRWGLPRTTRSEGPTSLVRTLEDTPFYSRSLVRTEVDGQPALAVHEGLSLRRFCHPVVQWMLPFRLRRGWRA
jgi:carotenoid 1,2-hydratase